MKNGWCIRFISSFSCSPNTIGVTGQEEVKHYAITGINRSGWQTMKIQTRPWAQKIQTGYGPKLQKFKGFMKKPHLLVSSTSYLIYKKLAQTPYWT